MEVAERSDGSLQGLRDVYGLIQEKGFFWAFDQIVESGQIPYEEIMKCRVLERKSVKFFELVLSNSELREGVGIATNNVAEYRALKEGFKHIRVHGDSMLVSGRLNLVAWWVEIYPRLC
ncbi:hypothetical protein Q3G72_007803 [Acer saccharum]|nr:hypothetical protein Q3G72_007803 [Acer saccharum]